MRYAGIIYNDFSSAQGVCLTVFTQGCNLRCKGCHNPGAWDFDGGKPFTIETMHNILEGIEANGIKRNLCIQGGEPLADRNIFLTRLIIDSVKEKYPDIKIYLWTGYTYEDLQSRIDTPIKYILSTIDCLIDGPYIEEKRDITLHMRGSRNQRVIYLKEQETK